MRKSVFLKLFLACAVGAFAVACGDDDDDGHAHGAAGSTSKAGDSGGGKAGSGGSTAAIPDDDINDDCPGQMNDIGPKTGKYAPKGKCCYRTSNSSRVDPKADTRTLEYRFNYFQTINHKKSLPEATIGPLTIARFDNEEQSILLRQELPQKDGKVTDGEGKLTLAAGRYNCDGTYSFYDDKSAPTNSGNGDVKRWESVPLPAKVTASKNDISRVKVVYKDALKLKNRVSGLGYLGAAPNYALDWELLSMGFDITEMPTGDDNINCVGSRSATAWKPAGRTESFALVEENAKDVIDALGVQLCQLFGFGSGEKQSKADCNGARCEPGSADCLWIRLPDSLCPKSEDERAKWGCHLGADGNPDNPKPNCTDEAPASVNPDEGGPAGQCCDPLGKSTKGLPACNAWLTINEFTAASAEINDKPAAEFQMSCHGK